MQKVSVFRLLSDSLSLLSEGFPHIREIPVNRQLFCFLKKNQAFIHFSRSFTAKQYQHTKQMPAPIGKL
jgi:hypothetical protein